MISYSNYATDARVHRYAGSLANRGDHVDMIGLGTRMQSRFEVVKGVNVYRMQTRRYDQGNPLIYLISMLSFFFRSAWQCTVLHFKHRYDVLHFHNLPDFGVFCTVIPKLMGAKVILDIHDLVPEFYQRKFGLEVDHVIIRLLKWVEKISCGFADHVITVTTIWEKTVTDRSTQPEKCSVMLNSPITDLFYPRNGGTGTKNGKYRLVYHGNLTEIFGVDLAVRALPLIAEAIPNAELHIYGRARDAILDLTGLAKELGVEKRVFFNKPVPRIEVPNILHNSDMGIDPKRDGILAGEGLSNKCMEFFAVGLPAVVSSIKAATTYYDDTMVTFFKPGNPEDLAKKVIALYKNPSKQKDQVRNALRFIEDHGWPVYEKRYFALVDALAEEK